MNVRLPKRLRELFSDMPQYTGAIILAGYSCITAFEHIVFNKVSLVIDLSPVSIVELEKQSWLAVFITVLFSLILFVIGWFMGYALALVAGLASEYKFTRFVSHLFKDAMAFFYIVPVALIISLVYGQVLLRVIGYVDNLDSHWPPYLAVIIPLLTAVFILSGYQIFDSCFRSMVEPDDRAQQLIDAMYVPIRDVPIIVEKG